MFGNVDDCISYEVVDNTSGLGKEQSPYSFEDYASISEEKLVAYEEDGLEWARLNEEEEITSSLDEGYTKYSYKPGLFVTPYGKEYHSEPFDRKESRKAKFIEKNTPNIKHKRHSSIRARYLLDQEIVREIKKSQKYLELDRQDSIKTNEHGLYKEKIEGWKVENIFLQSSMEHEQSIEKLESSQLKVKKEVSITQEHTKTIETKRKKKGFFRRIFGCFVL